MRISYEHWMVLSTIKLFVSHAVVRISLAIPRKVIIIKATVSFLWGGSTEGANLPRTGHEDNFHL